MEGKMGGGVVQKMTKDSGADVVIETLKDHQENRRRIGTIVSKIKKYVDTGEINHNMVMNYIIILSNCYGINLIYEELKKRLPDTPQHLFALNTFFYFWGKARNLVFDPALLKKLKEERP